LSSAASSFTRLVLVRHGESRATVEQVAGGPLGCKGLTERGAAQAEALRDRLAASGELAGAGALFASTLPRAIETAEILAPALGLSVVTDVDLCEMHPGLGDGLTWEEWRERFGGFSFAVEPYRQMAPGGESFAEFQLRVGRILSRLVDEYAGGLVVAACHGGVIEGSLRFGLGLAWPGTSGSLGLPANTSMTEWACTATPDQSAQWQLLRYNDAAHLSPG
jgi:2,3-bisphosphoglycerate-dependent phosphoglycerate mutase